MDQQRVIVVIILSRSNVYKLKVTVTSINQLMRRGRNLLGSFWRHQLAVAELVWLEATGANWTWLCSLSLLGSKYRTKPMWFDRRVVVGAFIRCRSCRWKFSPLNGWTFVAGSCFVRASQKGLFEETGGEWNSSLLLQNLCIFFWKKPIFHLLKQSFCVNVTAELAYLLWGSATDTTCGPTATVSLVVNLGPFFG